MAADFTQERMWKMACAKKVKGSEKPQCVICLLVFAYCAADVTTFQATCSHTLLFYSWSELLLAIMKKRE